VQHWLNFSLERSIQGWMSHGSRVKLPTRALWVVRSAALIWAGAALVSSLEFVLTAQSEWLVAGLGSGALVVGLWREHSASVRFAAALFMGVGVTMSIGADGPLAAMDARAEPWNAGATTAYVGCWLLVAAALLLFGWYLECLRWQIRMHRSASNRREC
jgi:hypothetical protein